MTTTALAEIDSSTVHFSTDTDRYAKCIEVSKRIRWDIDKDVIRGRNFDFARRFLPEGLARIESLNFLGPQDKRRLSQIQGRTYANMFGLVERFIGAKMLEITRDHWFGDQIALEALVRFSDEELKHQALFRRIEQMVAHGMPAGYQFKPEPNAVAHAVMSASTWAVLALTCHIELFTQVHYRISIEPDQDLSALFRDVFLFHWKEESQHAILDELEWKREHERLNPAQRDGAVDDLIGLVAAVDGLVQVQAQADAEYFFAIAQQRCSPQERAQVAEALLKAYRWQYIVSGVQDPRFQALLGSMITPAQGKRIQDALAPLVAQVEH
jgi:hypothetical protein